MQLLEGAGAPDDASQIVQELPRPENARRTDPAGSLQDHSRITSGLHEGRLFLDVADAQTGEGFYHVPIDPAGSLLESGGLGIGNKDFLRGITA